MSQSPPKFTAEHVVAYDYKRSVGPVLGRFFTALRDRRLLASRAPGGRVLCPPMEHDPETGDALGEEALTEVGPGGVVTSWAWVSRPRERHPLKQPFAFALIRPDGATGCLVHAVDAGSEAQMRTGMRVRPRWRAARTGAIGDIECFEPEART